MDNSYALKYRTLYERHWWWRARQHAILAELGRVGVPHGGQSVLDIGCGDGLFFDALQQYGDVEGVEVDRSLVTEESRHRDRIHIRPFDEDFQTGKQYSLILMLDVLEHLPDPIGALRHASNLLTDDGVLLITVPAFRLLWTTHDDLNHHYTRYTKTSFKKVADEAEIVIDHMRYLFQWTCPVKLAIRFKETVVMTRPESPEVPAFPINGACYALSRFEQTMFQRVPVPFGSSLLAVCGHR